MFKSREKELATVKKRRNEWQPGCMKDVLNQIEEDHAKPTRVQAYPLKQIFVSSLDTKRCPLQGKAHSNDRLYAVIKLDKMRYTIRCHSPTCKGRESIAFLFNDSVRRSVYAFLSQEVKLPSIRFPEK